MLRAQACLAALFALLTAMPVSAGCDREDFVLAIDIGHSVRDPGATSARGVPEYLFNKNLAGRLLAAADKKGFEEAFIVNDADAVLKLKERTEAADDEDADLLISIHHDSMPAKYLSRWTHQGVSLRYGDQFRGHSIFYSEENDEPELSREFADLLGAEMRKRKLTPTLHHDGYRGRRLVDKELGIYRFNPLIVLYTADMPAVLFEAGVILNREEELLLAGTKHQDVLIDGILAAVDRFCAKVQEDD
jgi:N-acetylmuramoyl-L-alanine amidase